MSSLSIRGIDDNLSVCLKQAASVEDKSVNQFVLDILKQHLGIAKKKQFTQTFHDLDPLFGAWSNEEFENIQKKINAEHQIDKKLW